MIFVKNVINSYNLPQNIKSKIIEAFECRNNSYVSLIIGDLAPVYKDIEDYLITNGCEVGKEYIILVSW